MCCTGAAFEKHLETKAGAKSSAGVICVHVKPLLRELDLLSVCFQAQFKVLVMTHKDLQDMELDYLKEHLSSVIFIHSIRPGKWDMLWVPSTKSFPSTKRIRTCHGIHLLEHPLPCGYIGPNPDGL